MLYYHQHEVFFLYISNQNFLCSNLLYLSLSLSISGDNLTVFFAVSMGTLLSQVQFATPQDSFFPQQVSSLSCCVSWLHSRCRTLHLVLLNFSGFLQLDKVALLPSSISSSSLGFMSWMNLVKVQSTPSSVLCISPSTNFCRMSLIPEHQWDLEMMSVSVVWQSGNPARFLFTS